MNYVTLFCKGSKENVYGTAQCETLEDHDLIMTFAKTHGFNFVTGSLESPERLIEAIKSTYMLS
jgi:hypothetical protein